MTDLQVLRALLALPKGKLSANEKTVFQRMYDDVAGGMIISLSKKQRAWAQGVYAKLELDKPQNRGSEPVRVLDKARLHKTPFKESAAGLAQLEALRRKARELEDPSPEKLHDALLPATRKAVEVKAKAQGKTYEDIATAFIRSLMSP